MAERRAEAILFNFFCFSVFLFWWWKKWKVGVSDGGRKNEEFGIYIYRGEWEDSCRKGDVNCGG